MATSSFVSHSHRVYRQARLLPGRSHPIAVQNRHADDVAHELAWSLYTPNIQQPETIKSNASSDFYSHETFWALSWSGVLQYFTIFSILCKGLIKVPIVAELRWLSLIVIAIVISTTYVHRTGGQHIRHKIGAHFVPIVERLFFQNGDFGRN